MRCCTPKRSGSSTCARPLTCRPSHAWPRPRGSGVSTRKPASVGGLLLQELVVRGLVLDEAPELFGFPVGAGVRDVHEAAGVGAAVAGGGPRADGDDVVVTGQDVVDVGLVRALGELTELQEQLDHRLLALVLA